MIKFHLFERIIVKLYNSKDILLVEVIQLLMVVEVICEQVEYYQDH